MNASGVLPPFRSRTSLSPRGNPAFRLRHLCSSGITARHFQHRLPELGFTHEQQTDVARRVRPAVVGGFGGDVGHVDAFAECVAAYGCFWRRDSETLREDTAVVGASGAVP